MAGGRKVPTLNININFALTSLTPTYVSIVILTTVKCLSVNLNVFCLSINYLRLTFRVSLESMGIRQGFMKLLCTNRVPCFVDRQGFTGQDSSL